MALTYSSQHSFLAGNLLSPSISKLSKSSKPPRLVPAISCQFSMEDKASDSSRTFLKLSKLAFVTLTAGVLTLGSIDPAAAAKSGGRVGGQAFRPSAPRSSGPRINNSRTNIYINPPVAPPLVGGYGYGYGLPFFGGWGWSPFTFFAPGPSAAVGIGGGFEVFLAFLVLGAVASLIRGVRSGNDEDDDDF